MELGLIKRGRWRPLCPLTGRVLGSRRRLKVGVMRDDAVLQVPLSAVLNVVPGRRLYSSPSPPPSQHRFDNDVNGNDAGVQVATDLESRNQTSAASLNADMSTASGGWSPLPDVCKHVGVQTDDETSPSHATSRDADAQTSWGVWRPLPRHVGVQTDDLRCPSRATSRDADVSNKENRRTSKKTGDLHTAAASCAAGEGAGGADGGGDWHELLVDAQDVRLLRRYARNHHTNIDLERFDRDDRYKTWIFFKWNPLVRVDRCRHIAKLLQDRNNPQATEYFARQLGLCSTADNGSEARSGDTSAHKASGRKQLACPGSLVSKRNSGTMRREYSVQEDRALLRWLLAKEGRGRCVSGNRLWRELEPAFTALVGTSRSWHSLRNRYLRYLLPALDSPALLLQPSAARRLREGAALGEMRARRRERRGSLPSAAPAPRGAFSRAPLAVRRLVPSPRAPTDVRPAQGGRSSQSPRVPRSSGAQQARVPRSSGAQQAPRVPRSSGAQQAPRVPRSSGAQQAPRVPRSSGAQQAPRLPRSSGAQQAPRVPRSSGAQQASRVPRSSGAQQAPRVPRSSGAQKASRVPRSSGAQQVPRRSPRLARDEPVAITDDVVKADDSPKAAWPGAPHGKRRLYTPRA